MQASSKKQISESNGKSKHHLHCMCIEYAVGNSSAGITTDSKALKSIRLYCVLLEYFRLVFCSLGKGYYF